MRHKLLLSLTFSIALALPLAACGQENSASSVSSNSASQSNSSEAAANLPITIKHAFGETKISKKAERIATLGWGNHEIPLALGIVPVGMSKANWGDDDGDGVLPWDKEKLNELGGETPVLFDETDAIPFEQVADTQPDVILASYSGITEEDYEKLSKIAPVVAYPDKPWHTTMEELIKFNTQGMGTPEKASEIQDKVDTAVASALEKYPNLKEKKVLFSAFGSQDDKSKLGFYSLKDPRAGFLQTIGLQVPNVVTEDSPKTETFWIERSAEEPEVFDDVDVIIAYGSTDNATNEKTLKELQSDPLLGKIPAIRDGHIAFIGDGPVGAAAGASPMGIVWGIDKYLSIVDQASK